MDVLSTNMDMDIRVITIINTHLLTPMFTAPAAAMCSTGKSGYPSREAEKQPLILDHFDRASGSAAA
jgi:hypothetical protein